MEPDQVKISRKTRRHALDLEDYLVDLEGYICVDTRKRRRFRCFDAAPADLWRVQRFYLLT